MHKLSPTYSLTLCTLLSCGINIANAETDSENKVRVGQVAPSFTAVCTDNTKVALADYRGKVVLIDFFTTWCAPCRAELPHLEKELWQQYQGRLVVLAIGREASVEEMKEFRERHKLTFPVLADPKREIYDKYATKIIPRNYVIDTAGKIVYCSKDFDEADFDEMKKVVARLVPQVPSTQAPSRELQLAASEIATGMHIEAVSRLTNLLEKTPSNAQARYMLGVALALDKQYDRAAIEYRNALKYAKDEKLKEMATAGLNKIHRQP